MPEQAYTEASFLQAAEMGLGAWAWGDRSYWNYGHGYTDEDISAAFQVSLDAGINFIDTAEVYGGGRSEHLVGQLLKQTTMPVFVATKFFPMPYRLTKNTVVTALRRSLERLQLKRVDLYQQHWPSPVVPVETYVEGLALCMEAGMTAYAGVSNFNVDQMQRAVRVLARHNMPLASNQVEYHLLKRNIEKNGVLNLCRESGIRLIAYSPLAQGLLTGKYTVQSPPSGPRGRKYAGIIKEIGALVALLGEIGEGHGKTRAQVALNWVICKGGLPIPGAKNAAQAQENAGALGWRLAPEEVKALDEASDKIS